MERQLLDQGFSELGLDASETQRVALLQLAELLEVWAERLNLTAHRTRDAILRRLILDAAALSQVLPAARKIADLGSGAGFPGIPFAILRPESHVTLVEARERRHYFQRAALRTLRLTNVQALRGRAEDLETSPHDLVVAQALAKPTGALQWMLPWAAVGGALAIPGAAVPPEIGSVHGVEKEKNLSYTVPCGGPKRTVWLGRRKIAS